MKIFEDVLNSLNIKLDTNYECNIELASMFKETKLNTNCNFSINENKESPLIICHLTNGDLFFADKNITIDKYDKASINENNDFKLMNTYSISLFEEFTNKLNLKEI